ncbi:MAG: hypothetical protein AB7N91_11420 [Candidatus Tectimicrobiota bacterium]
MSLFALLKTQWTVMGLDAPAFIWLAALTLVLWAALQLVRLWRIVSCEIRMQCRVLDQLATLAEESGSGTERSGCSPGVYAAVERIFAECRVFWPLWQRFADQILVRYDAAGQPRVWSAESAACTFNVSTMVEPRLNQHFFAAVPGMLTSMGLLCTFVAILVSLLEVRLVNEQFQGLDTLLGGLSGKFLSSITALGVATIFLASERCLLHRLHTGVHALSTRLDELILRLPMAVLLNDLQGNLREHLRAMPTAVERLEQAITGALERSGETVATALGRLQPPETSSLSQALAPLAQLLEGMQTEWRLSQHTLGEVLTLTRTAALEHMAASQAQAGEVATALQSVMGEMHLTAGLSTQQIAAALTAVVHDLSTQVSTLGQQMTKMVLDSAGQASGAASAVLERADGWAARSAAQLAQLLEQHQGQLESRQAMQVAFDTTLREFKETLGQYMTVTVHVRQIAAAAADITRAMKEAGSSVERTASLAALQAERLTESVRQQGEMQQHMAQGVRQSQQATRIMQEILTRLEQQVQHTYAGVAR